jgi:hypothetical protein
MSVFTVQQATDEIERCRRDVSDLHDVIHVIRLEINQALSNLEHLDAHLGDIEIEPPDLPTRQTEGYRS